MESTDIWSTVEGRFFLTEYAYLFDVTWLREVYGLYRNWYVPSVVRAEL